MLITILKQLFFTGIILLTLQHDISTAQQYKEEDIKAAFIYHLLHYIEWPNQYLYKDSYINLCIIGQNPFKKPIKKQIFINRKIRVQIVNNPTQKHCPIIFISHSESTNLIQILNQNKYKPQLTISDINQFAKHGGMVGFKEINHTIKIELNLNALKQHNFTIDPNLLEVAAHVY